MRDIKFRGINKSAKQWAYGDLLHKDGKVFMGYWVTDANSPSGDGYVECEVIPETIGQYTGLHDKNGTDIYEGNIMTDDVNNYAVVFYEGAWRLKLNAKNGDTWWKSLDRYTNKLKVIGNIYENPELLKEDD